MTVILKRLLPTVFLLAVLLTGTVLAEASPEITDARATAAYWTQRNPQGDAVLLTPSQVEATNESLRRRNDTLTDLSTMPESVSGAEVQERIEKVQAIGDFDTASQPDLYKNGSALTAYSYSFARKNCNIAALPETVTVRYGVVTRRANLRLLPETAGWFESAGDVHYDTLQATALDPAEPVAVLGDSYDKKFAFVRTRFYDGWLAKSDFAETDRTTWEGFVHPADFAVVTANKTTIANGAEESLLFQMGAKIPLTAGANGAKVLLLPVSDNGALKIVKRPTAFDDTLHEGFLPCTENNFVRQGFRFLGDEYGWGGLDDSVDCSSFVGDVYRSMGIELPRDADQQAKSMPSVIDLTGMGEADRLAALESCVPGTLLANNTHVMMYLGQDDAGTPIVLQSMSSWFSFGSDYGKHYLRKVIASTATFLNFSGVPYINGVHYLGSLR
ncbi:NlpC/P60 family protein [Mitsuokella jalaludinii]|uniref:NlpC/P60 family protein n=1 Tax=Mitsuokella jalaludinii TaxID=187979 RepID=UPI003F89D5F7